MAREKRLRRKNNRPASVFLNIPYDSKFQKHCLAYIAGVSAFGLVPRAALEIPGGQRRLERIVALIQSCRYSIHDLSRVELDRKAPRTPRFNMPFELGLTVAWEILGAKPHTLFVCESRKRRLSKSLSDMDGTDAYIHDGTIRGIFRELRNALVRQRKQASVADMMLMYRRLRDSLPSILKRTGARSAFEASSFRELCVLASAAADTIVLEGRNR